MWKKSWQSNFRAGCGFPSQALARSATQPTAPQTQYFLKSIYSKKKNVIPSLQFKYTEIQMGEVLIWIYTYDITACRG